MSDQYKASLVMRGSSGLAQRLLDWKERPANPDGANGKNIRLRERIREQICSQSPDLRRPIGSCAGLPGRRQSHCRLMRLERIFAGSVQISSGYTDIAVVDPLRLTMHNLAVRRSIKSGSAMHPSVLTGQVAVSGRV